MIHVSTPRAISTMKITAKIDQCSSGLFTVP
jgi:hypothetical protein